MIRLLGLMVFLHIFGIASKSSAKIFWIVYRMDATARLIPENRIPKTGCRGAFCLFWDQRFGS